MHIEKIIVTNFKCFKEKFELVLNPGLNIIVGDNEAGKSTILEAIHLALTGWFKGRYIHNELTQYLFNKTAVNEYLKAIKDGNHILPPSITIELFFTADTPALFMGNNNSDRSNASGLSFHIEFDSKYQEEYEIMVKAGGINSLPIEYYHFYWESFARDEKVTTRSIPIKSALIDSSNNRLQNGSDAYIGRIVKDFLDPKEVVDISQAHRRMKELFMEDAAIKNINKKIQTDSKISNKNIELSVELSSKNAWESSLVTYLDEIPFHHIGQGEQAIIKTKLALSHKKAIEANVLLIEEPENHLSHAKLNGLIDDIKSGSIEKQIVISTHSSFVANKLGLDSLILINAQTITKLTDLSASTYNYFKKLSGYDTLRLVLCKTAILVEGDSDELIVQKAYSVKHGKLPIQNEIDVISVGTAFLRFLEISEKIAKETIVITDTDSSLEAIKKKYENYLNGNKKANIYISFDETIDSGELIINGKPFNYNTLEPKLLKSNSLELFNAIFETTYASIDDMHKYMKANKTECAIKLFDTTEAIQIPAYISDVI